MGKGIEVVVFFGLPHTFLPKDIIVTCTATVTMHHGCLTKYRFSVWNTEERIGKLLQLLIALVQVQLLIRLHLHDLKQHSKTDC